MSTYLGQSLQRFEHMRTLNDISVRMNVDDLTSVSSSHMLKHKFKNATFVKKLNSSNIELGDYWFYVHNEENGTNIIPIYIITHLIPLEEHIQVFTSKLFINVNTGYNSDKIVSYLKETNSFKSLLQLLMI